MNNYLDSIISTIFKDVESKGKVYLSNFLTINEQEIFMLEAKHYPNLTLSFDGGFTNAERMKAMVSSVDKKVSFEIEIIKILYNKKYLSLSHRNILGTIISLGVSRDRIGDICITDDAAYVAVSESISNYIVDNLVEINHQKVTASITDETIVINDTGIEMTIFVSSARLDAVIAQAFKLSRDEASEMIKHEMVKVNQKVTVKSFQNLKACDIISVAHKGRIKIIDDSTTSRSGRIVMKICIYR